MANVGMVRNNEAKYQLYEMQMIFYVRHVFFCFFLAQYDVLSPMGLLDTIVISYLPTLEWHIYVFVYLSFIQHFFQQGSFIQVHPHRWTCFTRKPCIKIHIKTYCKTYMLKIT